MSRNLWSGLLITLSIVWGIWWHYGVSFYDRVVPFYDSLSYQDGYLSIAAVAEQKGPAVALTRAWNERGNNVVLYKFFAALVGPVLPSPREGLFVYLFSIHLLGVLALVTTIQRFTNSTTAAVWALAYWLAIAPFGLLRDGIGDQRLDLSSGSLYLLFVALGFHWLKNSKPSIAALTGFAATLAVLHRPILIPAVGIMGLAILVFGLRRSPLTRLQQIGQLTAAISPITVLAGPWFIRHFEELKTYYFSYGPDSGNGDLIDSATFNISAFTRSVGPMAWFILAVGLILLVRSGLRIRYQLLGVAVAAVAVPLGVLIAFRTHSNVFVQQVALFVPPLFFTSLAPESRGSQTRLPFHWLVVAILLFLLPFRLGTSLRGEALSNRDDVTNMALQIATSMDDARLAGFHDLPVSVPALISVARDNHLSLRLGDTAFYPTDFGLNNDYLNISDSPETRSAVRATLTKIQKRNDAILLPTAETTFRLWTGLYSHRLIPLIREEMDANSSFEKVARIGPVQDVYFDLYRVR